MSKKIYLTIQRKDGNWSVKYPNSSRTTSVHHSKSNAWKETKRLARGTSSVAILQGKDGKILVQNTYELSNTLDQESFSR